MDGPARTLILLRHAKSDWSGDEVDPLRPLAKRGRRQAPEAGRWIAGNIDRVDLVVVSTAERARETWLLASREFALPPGVRFDDRVYASSGNALLGLVQELPDDLHTVVLVGHNPSLENLVATLTGREVSMPTSCVAVIAVPGGWSRAGATTSELRVYGRPPATLSPRS